MTIAAARGIFNIVTATRSSSLYAVVGKSTIEHDGTDPWPVCWRQSAEEAGLVVDALMRDAEAFASWKMKMFLNNSDYHYDAIIEQYIENKMMDPNFIEGCEYVVWQLPDDPKQVL